MCLSLAMSRIWSGMLLGSPLGLASLNLPSTYSARCPNVGSPNSVYRYLRAQFGFKGSRRTQKF